MIGRKPNTKEEKEFWKKAYKIGMGNGWCNGKFEKQDGNFIVKEDRLNNNSVCVIDDLQTLKEFFKMGNWCLGQAVIYKCLCFINQVNGGDEWLTMKLFEDGRVIDFESYTFRPSACDYQEEFQQSYLDDKHRGKPKEYYKNFFKRDIEELLNAKIVKSKGKERVIY